MTDLQKEFEATGYTSWINADLYTDGKIYTQEYTQWLEKQVLALRQPPVSSSSFDDVKFIDALFAEYNKSYKETKAGQVYPRWLDDEQLKWVLAVAKNCC